MRLLLTECRVQSAIDVLSPPVQTYIEILLAAFERQNLLAALIASPPASQPVSPTEAPPIPARQSATSTLVEPLTSRELEVLRLITAGSPMQKLLSNWWFPLALSSPTLNISMVNWRCRAVPKL